MKNMVKTTLKIDGMACSMCESHVNDAIRGAFVVKKVKSSHTKGITEILSEEAIEETALKNCLESTGYRLVEVRSEPHEKKSLFGR